MKKLFAFVVIFLVCLLFIFNSYSFASGINIRNYFIANSNNISQNILDIKETSANVYSVLKIVGIIIALCMMLYMAISYMIATPNKRAQLKERLFIFLIGVIFLMAGVAFLDWYEGMATTIANGL